jgi:DNA invertase Pin-like site-specific DNA recombinase
MSTRRTAVSYFRFSSPEQAKGESENRQTEMYRDFCVRHNLTPGPEVYADRGKSGYKDEHRKKGRLGVLIAAAKGGAFDPGTVIVIEAWDRLGRLRPDKQTALVAELLQTGVAIGVCKLNDVFVEDDFGSHKWHMLAAFIVLAYQESKQKAERLAHTWKKRRERARESGRTALTCHPAWVEMVNGEPRLVPERAAVVKRIFRLAADGLGYKRIVQALTKDDVKPFGEVVVRKGRSRSHFVGRWTPSYLALILNDRRAVGEVQFRLADGKPDGKPLAILPAAVTEDEYRLARFGQERRLNRKDTRGREVVERQGRHVNAFRGLLRHARDGEGFLMHNRGTTKNPHLSLINVSGFEGRAKHFTFPYFVFEEAVLGQLREVNGADVLPGAKESPGKAGVLRAELKNVRGDVEALKKDLKAGYSKALADVLREKEAEEERLVGELQDELVRSAVPAERAWKEFRSLADAIQDADDPDAALLKVRTLLRAAVESIWVLIVPKGCVRRCAVQVHFVGGARRDYLIRHRTAAYRRAEEWSVRSLTAAELGDAGGFDLREPKHAAALTRILENADPNDLPELT